MSKNRKRKKKKTTTIHYGVSFICWDKNIKKKYIYISKGLKVPKIAVQS